MADLVYPPVIGMCRLAFAGLGLRITVRGGEHVPRTGGALMVSNHVSHLDFIFVGLGARPSRRFVRFMAKQPIFKHRAAGPLMRGMHHISVDRERGAASFAEALRMLRAGEVVGIFPEATISRSFDLKEFKTGATRLAQGANVPLIPVAVWGSQRLWTYDENSSLKQRGVPVHISVGPPVELTEDTDTSMARLRAAVQVQLDDARSDYPDDGTGQWWQPQSLGGTAPPPPSPPPTAASPPA